MRAPRPDLPPDLTDRLIFSGDDLAAAQRAATQIFSPHTVRRVDLDEDVRVRQYAATVADMTISRIAYGAAVEIHACEHPDRFFCVQIPHRGRAQVASAGRQMLSTPRVASVPTPSRALHMRWEAGTAQTVIKIGVPTVRRYLAALLGHDPRAPIEPKLALDLDGVAGQRWRAIYELLLAEVAAGEAVPGRPTASAAALQDMVLSSLLMHHPNNYTEELTCPSLPGTRPYVRRAIDFADQNLATPLTVATLAEVAGVGVRALQDGFRESVGASPTTWIRERRLDRAHAELVATEPGDGTTVTDIALRWGFSHLGRFATCYRERFGVPPSRTLRG